MNNLTIENEYDKLLKIKSSGTDSTNSSFENYPYEPTPYIVLEQLVNTGLITKQDKIIDYGCGKGRVDFYIAYMAKANMIGIELDERLYSVAITNLKEFKKASKVKFLNICASNYKLDNDVTGAYFFNPFSLDIFKKVLNNIYKSLEECNREFYLYFYYISNEYLKYLFNQKNIILITQIDCKKYFKTTDNQETLTIFKIKIN